MRIRDYNIEILKAVIRELIESEEREELIEGLIGER